MALHMPPHPSHKPRKQTVALILSITAIMLCLLLFIATIDTIPDPPALGPQGGQQSLISHLSHHAPTPPLRTPVGLSSGADRFLATRFWSGPPLENQRRPVSSSFVRHASDPSPPLQN